MDQTSTAGSGKQAAITGTRVRLGLSEALERLAAVLGVAHMEWAPAGLAVVAESSDATRQPNGKLEIHLSG